MECKLDLHSGISWNGGGANDTLTVTSLYGATAAVPEPSSLFLVTTATSLMLLPHRQTTGYRNQRHQLMKGEVR
jgi:hypothetical protein